MSEAFFDGILIVLGLAHVAPMLAPIAYVRSERSHRRAWEQMPLPARPLAESIYRTGAPVIPGYVGRAPGLVRLAAASCYVFGAMFVPGAVFLPLVVALYALLSIGQALLVLRAARVLQTRPLLAAL